MPMCTMLRQRRSESAIRTNAFSRCRSAAISSVGAGARKALCQAARSSVTLAMPPVSRRSRICGKSRASNKASAAAASPGELPCPLISMSMSAALMTRSALTSMVTAEAAFSNAIHSGKPASVACSGRSRELSVAVCLLVTGVPSACRSLTDCNAFRITVYAKCKPCLRLLLCLTATLAGAAWCTTGDMAEGDATFAEVVGGHFQRDFIACQNADVVLAHFSTGVRDNGVAVIQGDTKTRVGQNLSYETTHFDQFFFSHICFL